MYTVKTVCRVPQNHALGVAPTRRPRARRAVEPEFTSSWTPGASHVDGPRSPNRRRPSSQRATKPPRPPRRAGPLSSESGEEDVGPDEARVPRPPFSIRGGS